MGSSVCECGVCVEIDKKVCGLLKVKEDAAEVRARVEVLSSRRGAQLWDERQGCRRTELVEANRLRGSQENQPESRQQMNSRMSRFV